MLLSRRHFGCVSTNNHNSGKICCWFNTTKLKRQKEGDIGMVIEKFSVYAMLVFVSIISKYSPFFQPILTKDEEVSSLI